MKSLIIFGADHAGFKLKESLKDHLAKKGFAVEDMSPDFIEGDDYPLVAKRVTKEVLKGGRGMVSWGILVCDTGAGVAIAANRFKDIRAAPCYSVSMARHSRTDNDANVLCLGQETTPLPLAKKIVDVWLETEFSKAERHKRRVKQIDRL